MAVDLTRDAVRLLRLERDAARSVADELAQAIDTVLKHNVDGCEVCRDRLETAQHAHDVLVGIADTDERPAAWESIALRGAKAAGSKKRRDLEDA